MHDNFFASYLVANIVCVIIFGIFLGHDVVGVDRQEKQIKFDHALVAFMCYFVSDSFWAAVEANIIPKTKISVVICHFSNYIVMATVTYMWLRYVMAVENTPRRERKLNKFAIMFPFILSTIALVTLYFATPETLIDESLNVLPVFDVFLIIVPCINIAAVVLRTMGNALKEKNPADKRKHIYIGTFPLVVVAGGLIQVIWLPDSPIFCLSCTVLMITIYIQSIEAQVSTDELTNLNNRTQLMRYVTQSNNLYIEGKTTFVFMLDVNNFKSINDTYGHAEGDRALMIIADSLKKVISRLNMPTFIARYGGDEFVLIVYADSGSDVSTIISDIRGSIDGECKSNDKPYSLSVSGGFDKLMKGQDTFQKCLQRADKKLYLDKEYCKLGAAAGKE